MYIFKSIIIAIILIFFLKSDVSVSAQTLLDLSQNVSTSSETEKKLKISNVQITNIATDSATIIWDTNISSDSLIEYGLEKNRYFQRIYDPNLVTSHSLNINNTALVPGLRYFLKITSKNTQVGESSSYETQIQFTGYKIIIRVVDTEGKVLSGIPITLYADKLKGVTNEDGEVIFENVTPGNHLLVADMDEIQKLMEIEVLNQNTLQEFSFTVDTTEQNRENIPVTFAGLSLVNMLMGLGVLILFIVTILLVLLRRREFVDINKTSLG